MAQIYPICDRVIVLFFFNDTATTEIYTVMNTLSLHDALPISPPPKANRTGAASARPRSGRARSEEHTSELQSLITISYAVFCLKKKRTRSSIWMARSTPAQKPRGAASSRVKVSLGIDLSVSFWCFFFNDTPTTEIYTVMNTLSLHDALPIWRAPGQSLSSSCSRSNPQPLPAPARSEEHTSELQSLITISYAVFCLKNKTTPTKEPSASTTPSPPLKSPFSPVRITSVVFFFF